MINIDQFKTFLDKSYKEVEDHYKMINIDSTMVELTIDAPDDEWVERLRQGHKIWLVKENEVAEVEWAWEPPGPGRFAGRIGIRRPYKVWDQHQTWFVTNNGCGMDGKPLFKPIENNLPDNPDPIPEPEIRQVYRELNRLKKKVEYLYLMRGA